MSDKQVALTIDGQPVTVPEGTLVIGAADWVGLYVPRFCDLPYLMPLGACRQCMVEVEGQRKPLTSCTTVCTDGMVVKTQLTSAIAKDAQEGVLEMLLINHPLDCPVCDKGGECPLQDQTLAYGPGGSRFGDAKRRFVKPVAVNQKVYLDRERCVLCARCTRFASEISGDPFIELFERGALEQVAIFEDEPYESNFSGNVIQICPVGALTSKSFRFLARPFDMTSTESTCTQCASGCAITIQERRNNIVRVLAADDPTVNDEWSCDKGRFGHAYVGHQSRITEPMVRKSGELVAVSWAEAVRVAASKIDAALQESAPIAVVTGANLLDEDAYALSRFARTVLATNDILVTTARQDDESLAVLSQAIAVQGATNEAIDDAMLIVVAGCDLYEESPIVFLRVRKAAESGAKVIQVNARRAKLPGTAMLSVPGALAQTIQSVPPAVEAAGAKAVILAGSRLAESPGALSEAWNLAARTGAAFGWIPRKAGARGALRAGLHPSLLPADRATVESVWGELPARPGRDATTILTDMAAGKGLTFLVGADPAGDYPDHALASAAVAGAPMIAVGMFVTGTSRHADVILPVATSPEREGTITNWEGRARAVHAAVEPAGLSVPDWEVYARLAGERGIAFPRSLAEIRDEMARVIPPLSVSRAPVQVAAAPLRDGRGDSFALDLVTYRLLIDRGTLMVGADDLAASTEPPFVELNRADAVRLSISDGDAVRVSGPNGSGRAVARVGDSVNEGVVFIPADQPGLAILEIADLTQHVPAVAVEAVAVEAAAVEKAEI